MKVSIITVSYNAAATIEKTILSVLGQSYHNIEYIVVDGLSKDGTVDIINRYKEKIDHLVVEPDGGIYFAMNKGVSLATGDVVGILNADDVYNSPDIIAHLVETLANSGAEAVYGDLVYVNGDKITRYWTSGTFRSPAQFKWGWMPPHPSFFVKKELYEKYGIFNTTFRTSADYELMLRFLCKNKVAAAYLPEVVVRMQVGGVSNKSVSNRLNANKEDRRAWEVNGMHMPFFTPFLKPLRKIFQFRL